LKIRDIFTRVILKSGQFLLHRKNLEIDLDAFRILVEDALAEYSKSIPYTKNLSLNLTASRSHTFMDDSVLLRKPDWVAEATPTRFSGTVIPLFNAQSNSDIFNDVDEGVFNPWLYNDSTYTLTVPYSAHYKVVTVYDHLVDTISNADGTFDYEVKTISPRDRFLFDLITGLFLQGIGRSRRAFTLNDLPITMDSDQIISEGKEMETQALEEIHKNKLIRLAFS